MDASRVLIQAAVAALVLAGLTAPADAAGTPTCRGLPATIVGEPGGQVDGTDGDDVMVTNAALSTYGNGGDDTICVTGSTYQPSVDSGAGDDVVDTTAITGLTNGTIVVLGAGADTFVGGAGRDAVITGTFNGGGVDGDVDHVTTARGHDRVTTGQPGAVNHDDVDLGRGNDVLDLETGQNDGVLDGGQAKNMVELSLTGAGHWVVDDKADQVSLDGTTVTRWTAFRVKDLEGGDGVTARYVGSDDDDFVVISAQLEGLDLGAGDDLAFASDPTGEVTGGSGDDYLITSDARSVRLDLRGHDLTTSTSSARVDGFERYRVTAPLVRIKGNAAPNEFEYQACAAFIVGQGGDDVLSTFPFYGIPCHESGTRYRVYGGRGDDRLIGSPYRDHLAGGPGTDEVYGRGGNHDWCSGETHGGCELL